MTTTNTTATQRLASAFAERYGDQPDGVWRGPGRVNLIGEHTDYNEGLVLPFAIDRSTRVGLRLRPDRMARLGSTFGDGATVTADLDTLDPGNVAGWTAYPLGVVWAMEQEGVRVPGFDLLVDSDVPVGAGLSSSAALECAVALGLAELTHAPLSRQQLAAIGRRAENEVVGAPTGIMDQYASLLGAAGSAVFLDCRTEECELVPLPLEDSGLVLLVIDTKVSHSHATGGYAARRESCARAAAVLGVASLRDIGMEDLPRIRRDLDEETFRRVRHVVTENARVRSTVALLRESGPQAIGDVLDASHASMRDDFEISCTELDAAVDTARSCGALGARMTGGGFGGSAIALVPVGLADSVSEGIRRRFAELALQPPDIFAVRPAAGAARA